MKKRNNHNGQSINIVNELDLMFYLIVEMSDIKFKFFLHYWAVKACHKQDHIDIIS